MIVTKSKFIKVNKKNFLQKNIYVLNENNPTHKCQNLHKSNHHIIGFQDYLLVDCLKNITNHPYVVEQKEIKDIVQYMKSNNYNLKIISNYVCDITDRKCQIFAIKIKNQDICSNDDCKKIPIEIYHKTFYKENMSSRDSMDEHDN